jgi:hypothetical protein
MQQQQFIDIIKYPHRIEPAHLPDLEVLVHEYPFFETVHLLYTKGLHKHQAINYSKQLRKTAIVVNSRSVLYELLHQQEIAFVEAAPVEIAKAVEVIETPKDFIETVDVTKKISPISVTDSDIKVIYVNTVSSINTATITNVEFEPKLNESSNDEINIIKSIENETEAPVEKFNEEKLNSTIEQEINKSIIQSYVETDIIKTPELHKDEVLQPSSFTDWLKTIKKEAHTFQIETKTEKETVEDNGNIEQKSDTNDKKTSFFSQNKQIIDKIIESDPGRIKLGTGKFFTPAIDAKQSLLENEHLVTETLAKIYALQGNISKSIRAYEILSLKFPQKSVYFASLIEKLKTNK